MAQNQIHWDRTTFDKSMKGVGDTIRQLEQWQNAAPENFHFTKLISELTTGFQFTKIGLELLSARMDELEARK